FVNLVELGCTAILPGVYMGSLLQRFGQQVGVMHVLYTAFYGLVYVIPLIAILGNFVYTFSSARFSKDSGQALKLVAGLLMIAFGMMMLLKPEMLQFG
ncbi:NrdH-redoxin, partial [Candidatus Woesearchaeota archaeon CG_4_10_14_0_8_um_filter_47_5]